MTKLLALTAALAACLALAAPAVAKKKGKGGGTVDITQVVNAPIPDRTPPPSARDGVLTSTIDVGKQFKGRRIRDVNVTVQTLGTSDKTTPAGPIEAIDLDATLRAPNGAQLTLFEDLISAFVPPNTFAPFPSIGPLTLDDEAGLNIGRFEPHDPTELYAPYFGTARPELTPLGSLDNGPVRGAWTLTIVDAGTTGTSNLVSWRLNVVTGKPFLTK